LSLDDDNAQRQDTMMTTRKNARQSGGVDVATCDN